jgi:hypothetical protein
MRQVTCALRPVSSFDARDTRTSGFVDVGQRAAVVRNPCEERKVGLATLKVRSGPRLAQRSAFAFHEDRARQSARMHRAKQPVPRRWIVVMNAHDAPVSRLHDVLIDRKLPGCSSFVLRTLGLLARVRILFLAIEFRPVDCTENNSPFVVSLSNHTRP